MANTAGADRLTCHARVGGLHGVPFKGLEGRSDLALPADLQPIAEEILDQALAVLKSASLSGRSVCFAVVIFTSPPTGSRTRVFWSTNREKLRPQRPSQPATKGLPRIKRQTLLIGLLITSPRLQLLLIGKTLKTLTFKTYLGNIPLVFTASVDTLCARV